MYRWVFYEALEHLSVLPPGIEEQEDKSEQEPQSKVFVMAGGGSGELLMRALVDAHIPFIAGALNIGDSDHTLALRLAREVIAEESSPTRPSHLKQRSIYIQAYQR